jgi:hypothetical protein
MSTFSDIRWNREALFSPSGLERALLAVVAAGLAGSIGAFLMYVPIVPTIAVVTIVIGLVTMFLLGFYAGNLRDLASRRDSSPPARITAPPAKTLAPPTVITGRWDLSDQRG